MMTSVDFGLAWLGWALRLAQSLSAEAQSTPTGTTSASASGKSKKPYNPFFYNIKIILNKQLITYRRLFLVATLICSPSGKPVGKLLNELFVALYLFNN